MSTQTATITKALMVELEGKGALKLEPKSYVVSGGEGAIYKPSSDIIVKLYHDKDKMRKDGMPQKLTLLSKINSPYIVNPKGLVLEHQQPIGYYMKFEPGEALSKVVTNAYRQREGFTDDDAIMLVDGMRETVRTAHNHGAIMVDHNELNWLMRKQKKVVEPRILDVDSWKISHWDASVIMLSIRDWHTHGFNEGSDWFSWAVVTFQVFTGIHPYKGSLNGFKMNDIEARMKANKSVFTPGIKLNSAVRDFACIPGPLYDWYHEVFQNGLRDLVPPSPKDVSNKSPKSSVTKRVTATVGSINMVVTDLIYKGTAGTGRPVHLFPCGVLKMDSGKLINIENSKEFVKMVDALQTEIISTTYGYLVAEIVNAEGDMRYTLMNRDGITADTVMDQIKGQQLLRYHNRLFVVGATGMTEVTVKVFNKPRLVSLNTWPVLINSTNWFRGLGMQDALGAMFMIVPFGDNACEYVRTPELDGKTVIDAINGTRYVVLTIMDSKTGLYQKYEFTFSHDYKSYTLRITDTATPDLNMALLPKGVVAEIVDDGLLTITVPVNGNETTVKDSKIESSFMLCNWENKVAYIDGESLWSLSLK